MEKAKKKLTKARAGLVLDNPFFGSLALRMRLEADKNCKTAWIDGKTIGFNPAFIDGLTLPETKGLLAHEIMHVALCHHTRRGNRNPEQWNIAGDYAINNLLTGDGFVLPAGALAGKYKNQSAEQIYNSLPPAQGKGDKDPGGTGEVRDLPGKNGKPATEAEKKQAEQSVKVAITQAAQGAKIAGKLGAGLDRLIKKIIQPVIDWRPVLAEFVELASKNDYSWSLPNKRYITSGLYLPALHSLDDLGKIIIGIDTSGSVSDDDLAIFQAEINAILDAYNVEIEVIYCDTEINGRETFRSGDTVELAAKGGGGTRFQPVFLDVEKTGESPACLIYLTDLCGRINFNEPDYPVLWVNTWSDRKAPWGRTITMNN